jgi:hypothetical protein
MDCRNIQFQYTEVLSEADLDQLMRLFRAAAFWASDREASGMATATATRWSPPGMGKP